jgi:hypothetical protein
MITFLQAPFATALASTQSWFKIGKDVADMSVNLNPQTETVKNILDETNVNDNGYEPSFDVDTYYADPSDGDFYDEIKDISMEREKGDSCKTLCMEVLVDKTTGPFDAWVEDVMVKPQSYGGAQGGVRFPYNVAFCGNRRKGTVTFDSTTGAPTFTAASTV